jgi:hypothetical protein
MARQRKRQIVLGWLAIVILLIANGVVAVRYLGARAGQTYRWVCRESGAELIATPSKFGDAHLRSGRALSGRTYLWELVEPQPPSALLPWNWLALALDRPGPDPNKIVREIDVRGSSGS